MWCDFSIHEKEKIQCPLINNYLNLRHLTHSQFAYLIFGIVLVLALVFDLGLLSKKGAVITIKKALLQTAFWVMLAMAFFLFLWLDEGRVIALEYLSAYLMEWSLSIDNIFVLF